MAISSLPNDIPTSTQISVITGKIEHYNASGSLETYDYVYYTVPFFVWVVLAVVSVILLGRLTIELIKRF